MDQSLEQLLIYLQQLFLDSFNPYFSGSVTGTSDSIDILFFRFSVSILILVDQSLERAFSNKSPTETGSFNPYFSGSVTGTLELPLYFPQFSCFNPYFSGSVTGTSALSPNADIVS